MDLGLRDRVALVSAASRGLGRAVAEGLAAEGARVALCARRGELLEQAAEAIRRRTAAEVLAVPADVTRPEDCARFVTAAVERWGGIDILVNNSGGPAPGTFADTDESAWRDAVDSTLMNVVRLTRLVVPHMRARGGGRIVNIESVSVKQPIPGLVLSNAVRPAVVGLAKTLADELAPHGILVNTVCPGSHDTDRLRELAEVRARGSGRTPEEELRRLAANIPLGRLGRPEELAAVVVFLCSARASFVTGTTIWVDGGAYRGLM